MNPELERLAKKVLRSPVETDQQAGELLAAAYVNMQRKVKELESICGLAQSNTKS